MLLIALLLAASGVGSSSFPPPPPQRPAGATSRNPTARPAQPAPRVPAPQPWRTEQKCDRFVYLDNGAFKLAGQPFPLKSVNYRVEIVGREVLPGTPVTAGVPRVTVKGKPLDLFLTAYGSYSPDNNSWCRDDPSWNPDMRCCSDAASCAADLEKSVQQLQAMGVNSVRLLMDTFKIRDGVATFGIGRIPYTWDDVYLDLRDPAQRDAAILLQKRAVQFLGARGVRSLMLLNGNPYLSAKADWNEVFRTFVSGLSAALRDEPWLLGFDFMNEPTWASGAPKDTPFEIDKRGARDLVVTWVSAVRAGGNNQHALLTIGNAYAMTSMENWDPAFLPIDFNSSHIYPPTPVPWAASREFVEKETFFGSLGSCGGAIRCGEGRKPVIVGEFGVPVHELDPKTGAITKRAQANAVEQAAYLKAVAERARDCGYQGVQWWQHGDVHWGTPEQDHYGLWGDYRQVNPGKPVPQVDAMAMRPGGEALRALDLSAPRNACNRPAEWLHPLFGPGVSGSKLRYLGKVFDQHLKAVPFALITGRLSGGGSVYFTAFADAKGVYDFKTPKIVEKLRATQFGHFTTRWHIPVPLVPTLVKLTKAGAGDLPPYAPPSRNDESCRSVTY